MRITILGSGSRGNAVLFEAGPTRLLVDAGLSAREVRRRVKEARGVAPPSLTGVVVTHAHGDHAGHADTCARAFGATLHLTEATHRSVAPLSARKRIFGERTAFEVGEVRVHPLPVPHDAPQVALVLEHGGVRVGLATDLGEVRADLLAHLRRCDVLLIESNHDVDMLERGPYPAELRARVAGSHGHLSNAQCAALLRALEPAPPLVVLMHLSQKNNLPELARAEAERALAGRGGRLLVAPQGEALRVTDAAVDPAPRPLA